MAAGALTEQTAEGLEQVASATRRLDTRVVGSFLVGAGIGAAVGFFIGYRLSKKKLRSEILAEAEAEIAEMRELYRQKTIALEAQAKPSVEEIIEERGYSTKQEEVDVEERPIRPPVPTQDPRPPLGFPREIPTPIDPHARVFRTEDGEKDKDQNWNYSLEMTRRTPNIPYIIHQDEFLLNESGYEQSSLIYYAEDDILVDEDDTSTPLNNRENLIGPEALRRFGHGSDDYNIVHVRNSRLELEYVINRVPESWEKEILGLEDES
jgi:hypothetical protein